MLVDMSEVVDDPDLQDTFTVARRTESVSTYGVSSANPTVTSTVVGAVWPAGDQMLKRMEDQQHQGKGIEVVARFRFQGPSPGVLPDLITWGGDQFVVFFVEDYSHYGTGFVHVGAASIDNLDQPPSA